MTATQAKVMQQSRAHGPAIRALRERSGLTLADISGNVVKQGHRLTYAALSNIETGKRDASAPLLVAIARALRVPTPAIHRIPEDAR